ncbi:hypothetical protein ACFL0U_03090 [Pseudomonadota bacterium]
MLEISLKSKSNGNFITGRYMDEAYVINSLNKEGKEFAMLNLIIALNEKDEDALLSLTKHKNEIIQKWAVEYLKKIGYNKTIPIEKQTKLYYEVWESIDNAGYNVRGGYPMTQKVAKTITGSNLTEEAKIQILADIVAKDYKTFVRSELTKVIFELQTPPSEKTKKKLMQGILQEEGIYRIILVGQMLWQYPKYEEGVEYMLQEIKNGKYDVRAIEELSRQPEIYEKVLPQILEKIDITIKEGDFKKCEQIKIALEKMKSKKEEVFIDINLEVKCINE